ncbi:hypothetical protein HNP84_007065 [Thermocatellispora tengchongensis]|uniref:DUF3500 domain-containing protein n=1 Tax=Thermocatellispora tengchongensis TaxID=1073253 RepID=A0A840PHB2_9ACTN|nr:DUF3500 domain-containing protein [Thermocatellispora tengchongensis]MBB5137313.1 hypothetical protein [Thermocatellispora tengchongensis]
MRKALAGIALLATACSAQPATAPAPSLPQSRPNPVTGGPTVEGATETVVAAAETFLATLSAEQRENVLYDRDDLATMREWSNLPVGRDGSRNGLRIGDLSQEQQAAAMGVAEAMLSEDGFAELQGIIAAGNVLNQRGGGNTSFGSELNFIAFFGRPSRTERFTVQIGGHHLGVTTTYAGGRVSPTPAFTGVDPRWFEVAGRRVEPLRDEADSVFSLLAALPPEVRDRARLEGVFSDIMVGAGDDGRFPAPAQGVRVSDLPAAQQEQVTALIRNWVGDSDERVAEALMREYVSQYGSTHLAWGGSIRPDDQGAYLRLDGPRLWIEFSNQEQTGSGDEVHYHSIFRDKQSDYGVSS